ncbi:MAG: type I-E CRISPR-associated protein Cse1/CasA [Terrimicrobiaceae bacterium]
MIKPHDFNLIDHPWIPVSIAGKHELASLADTLEKANEIEDLDADPQHRVSLIRLLVAITQASCGAPVSADEWGDYGDDLGEVTTKYLRQPQIRAGFNLFGEGARFLQTPVVEGKKVEITKLVFHRATGNNSTLLDHRAMNEGRAMEPAEIALALLSFQNFYPLYGAGHKGKGPCVARSMAHAIPKGANLKDTILLNCLTKDTIDEYFSSFGRPIWETEEESTTSYLGRLVPRHRPLTLQSLTHFSLGSPGLEYPSFEEVREPSATVRVIQTKDGVVRGLLSCRTDRAIWRDLHSMMVVRQYEKSEATAPLTLQVQARRGADINNIWVGGVIADKAKIIDTLESLFTIPPTFFQEDGGVRYKQGVEFSERVAGRLKAGGKAYDTSLGGGTGVAGRVMVRYWHSLDRQASELLRACRDGEDTPYEERGSTWGEISRREAVEAYKRVCARQTPRQIQAFVEGMRKLEF